MNGIPGMRNGQGWNTGDDSSGRRNLSLDAEFCHCADGERKFEFKKHNWLCAGAGDFIEQA